jgi:hypothetical protein
MSYTSVYAIHDPGRVHYRWYMLPCLACLPIRIQTPCAMCNLNSLATTSLQAPSFSNGVIDILTDTEGYVSVSVQLQLEQGSRFSPAKHDVISPVQHAPTLASSFYPTVLIHLNHVLIRRFRLWLGSSTTSSQDRGSILTPSDFNSPGAYLTPRIGLSVGDPAPWQSPDVWQLMYVCRTRQRSVYGYS